MRTHAEASGINRTISEEIITPRHLKSIQIHRLNVIEDKRSQKIK